jgi:hypothetical protein
MEIKKKRTNIK